MRNILLAGAALLATTGLAMAASGPSITITTTVAKACSVAFADNSSLTLPANGTVSGSKTVNLNCNFSDSTADISFASTNGGVQDATNLDLPAAQAYNIFYAHDGGANTNLGDSSATRTALNLASSPLGKTGVFTAQLINPITVAGNFSDVMTVSVVP